MKNVLLIFVAILLLSPSLKSQNITAYTDYLQKFYVFDNARVQKLEHLPIQSSQVSDNYLAYVDNVGNFKVYSNGENTQLEGLVNNYNAYKGLVIYETAGIIKAFVNNNKIVLSAKVISYKAADNIAAFIDVYDRSFKIFTDTIYTLETHSSTNVITSYKVASNTLAYVDAQQNFYYYTNRKKQLVAEYFTGNYQVGQNIVAYTDNYDYIFKAFYKKDFIELDSPFPASYRMGKNMVAWVSSDGTFSVFYDGETIELASYTPDFYRIKDDVLLYKQNGYFYLFYKGKTIEVEPFEPEKYYIDNQTLVYKDQSGYIKAYIDGKFIEITRQPTKNLRLNGNSIYYTVNGNKPRVWFKGEELEF